MHSAAWTTGFQYQAKSSVYLKLAFYCPLPTITVTSGLRRYPSWFSLFDGFFRCRLMCRYEALYIIAPNSLSPWGIIASKLFGSGIPKHRFIYVFLHSEAMCDEVAAFARLFQTKSPLESLDGFFVLFLFEQHFANSVVAGFANRVQLLLLFPC